MKLQKSVIFGGFRKNLFQKTLKNSRKTSNMNIIWVRLWTLNLSIANIAYKAHLFIADKICMDG